MKIGKDFEQILHQEHNEGWGDGSVVKNTTVLLEDPISVLSSYVRWFPTIYNCSSRGSNTFGLVCTALIYAYLHADTQTYI